MMEHRGLVIGLTGQTGAGKSTVAALLRERGLTVIDADQIARAVMQSGSEVLAGLASAFGADILFRTDRSTARCLPGAPFPRRSRPRGSMRLRTPRSFKKCVRKPRALSVRE